LKKLFNAQTDNLPNGDVGKHDMLTRLISSHTAYPGIARLPQSEKTGNEKNYHHKTNNVDNIIHVSSSLLDVIGFTVAHVLSTV